MGCGRSVPAPAKLVGFYQSDECDEEFMRLFQFKKKNTKYAVSIGLKVPSCHGAALEVSENGFILYLEKDGMSEYFYHGPITNWKNMNDRWIGCCACCGGCGNVTIQEILNERGNSWGPGSLEPAHSIKIRNIRLTRRTNNTANIAHA